jgi:putative ABC transport system permease protein
MKEGRFFSKSFGTDSLAVVLNEKAVEDMGLGGNAIGTRLTVTRRVFQWPRWAEIGIHSRGCAERLSLPVAAPENIATGDCKLGSWQWPQPFGGPRSFKPVSNVYQRHRKQVAHVCKDRPFHYNFFDQTLAQQYLAEITTQKIFTVFSSLAIFIACIGLLGLVAYTTQQRTREISIRKVLGASSTGIVNMLSKDFLKLVLLASLIGLPVAWWGMHKWLEDFAYRINISWWVFVLAAVIAILIALITISLQSLKAALSNPVKNLRSE